MTQPDLRLQTWHHLLSIEHTICYEAQNSSKGQYHKYTALSSFRVTVAVKLVTEAELVPVQKVS